MQQASEVPITDAAQADVITSPEAAAHACPECESLMTSSTVDGDLAGSALSCPECGYEQPLVLEETTAAEAAAAPELTTRSMRCETCGGQLLVEPLPSGHGFKVIAIEKSAPGFDLQTTFGVSANGFPVCPTDGVGMIPLGPTPVGEAFRGIQDALTDQSEPVQPRLPGTALPFNLEKAYRAEHGMRQEVRAAEREYELKASAAKEAKKELDRVNDLLGKLMDENERREREARYAERGTLRPEQDSVCAYERQTGQPCDVCREARKRVREDESHDDRDLRIASLQEHLARRGIHLTALELATRAESDEDEGEFSALESLAHDDKKPLPAFVSGKSCVAGPTGADGQRCTTCGVLLHNRTDEDEDGAKAYPEGDRVGLDCAGDPNKPEPVEEDEPEPARQPRRRHQDPKDAAKAKSKATREERAAKSTDEKPARKKRTRA